MTETETMTETDSSNLIFRLRSSYMELIMDHDLLHSKNDLQNNELFIIDDELFIISLI